MNMIIDAMGGDHAPGEIVKGAVQAAQEFGLSITLVGRQAEVEQCLRQPEVERVYAGCRPRVTLVDAPEVITMEDHPATAVREKPNSSMAVGMRLLNEGKGDCLISAGSTGALLTGATLLNKRIRGIRRAALSTMLPAKGCKTLLIDCGANAECTAEYLLQFAFMGSFYMEQMAGVARPRVGLVNNGTEEGKGAPLQKEAYALLRRAGEEGRLRFVGNIEGRDVLLGGVDVAVCDGFTGNVLLKCVEGTALYLMSMLKDLFYENTRTKLAALMVKPGLQQMKSKVDYKEVGGAPLLGISKPVIKAHGSSDARAIRSAVEQAMIYTKAGIIRRIEENISHMTLARPNQTGKEQ